MANGAAHIWKHRLKHTSLLSFRDLHPPVLFIFPSDSYDMTHIRIDVTHGSDWCVALVDGRQCMAFLAAGTPRRMARWWFSVHFGYSFSKYPCASNPQLDLKCQQLDCRLRMPLQETSMAKGCHLAVQHGLTGSNHSPVTKKHSPVTWVHVYNGRSSCCFSQFDRGPLRAPVNLVHTLPQRRSGHPGTRCAAGPWWAIRKYFVVMRLGVGLWLGSFSWCCFCWQLLLVVGCCQATEHYNTLVRSRFHFGF